jgi:hypothetical protein
MSASRLVKSLRDATASHRQTTSLPRPKPAKRRLAAPQVPQMSRKQLKAWHRELGKHAWQTRLTLYGPSGRKPSA